MSTGRLLGLIVLLMVPVSCRHATTNPAEVLPTRELSLNASSATGLAPCDILFTGTFNNYNDTIRMHVPEVFLFGGSGKTVVRYALPDTSVPAKRTYSYVEHFALQGTYSMFMVLQTTTKDVFSDTLAVTIH